MMATSLWFCAALKHKKSFTGKLFKTAMSYITCSLCQMQKGVNIIFCVRFREKTEINMLSPLGQLNLLCLK